MQNDFLVEIQTEELPPKNLLRLANAFLQETQMRLQKLELSFGKTKFFATPRRIALLISGLADKQKDSEIERKGPAYAAAFDQDGRPTQACLGFAKSCGVSFDKLIKIENQSGVFVGYKQKTAGKKTKSLLAEVVQQALVALPIAKRMRWGNHHAEFVRPVHNVILLYGKEIVPADILGCRTGRKTVGHRFLSKKLIEIKKPSDYESALKKAFVIADFDKRKSLIQTQAKKQNKNVTMDENLLDEVTGLVEWPVAVSGQFDKNFLQVPQEALISAMQDHQRYFPVMKGGKLQAEFVAICNIKSKNTKRMIAGNERVLRARLSDAAFFYETDKKVSLESRVSLLKNIIFQAKLGTIFDKSERIAKLAKFISQKMKLDSQLTERAAKLAKTDLTTDLVGEFPELQGVAGYYYAMHDGENKAVAIAMKEQYLPRFSGDELPETELGCVIALADRLDTLTGVFGINQQPTGDKDPFGLRRAALGLLRILIEKKINFDLRELISTAVQPYSSLENKKVTDQVLNFILERLKPWYQEQNISPDVFQSVSILNVTDPYDFDCRVQAVQSFKKLPEAESLCVANKRVSNILEKYNNSAGDKKIDEALFEVDAERKLAEKILANQQSVMDLSKSAEYQKALTSLATLRKPVDEFFDHVMVMTDDIPRRENRLLMLKKLRELFLQVADVALLK
jgi:glycyl-tRNA synthetase beta chain